MSAKTVLVLFGLAVAMGAFQAVQAAPSSTANQDLQPYIEKLKKGMPEPQEQRGNQPYIDSLQNKLKPESSKSYIEQIQKTDPKANQPNTALDYTKREQERLGPPHEGGAIDAVAKGQSELKFKRSEKVTLSAGVKVGVSNSRSITSSAQANQFLNIYPNSWIPEVSLYSEYQPFHSETWGSIGLIGSVGFVEFKGVGRYADPGLTYTPPSGGTAIPFGANSQTHFSFIDLPLMAGTTVRFNLMKYVRPYVTAGGTTVLYFENRDDNVQGHKGKSLGLTGSVGAAFMLDWISRHDSIDSYNDLGVKHTYLMLEYNKLMTTVGDVKFDVSGIYSGFAFEF